MSAPMSLNPVRATIQQAKMPCIDLCFFFFPSLGCHLKKIKNKKKFQAAMEHVINGLGAKEILA